jgi:uncharacterized protein (TIGR02147 family)
MGTTSPPIDPTSVLRGIFLERVARNPSYSLRGFARNLGVSHAYLSMILGGKRRIPEHRAIQFSQLAGLNEAEAAAFVSACRAAVLKPAKGAAKPSSPSPATGRPNDYFRLQLDQFRVLSEWYHLAILDLTLLYNFKPDALWIARRLGLKRSEVTKAIARLERLGMLSVAETEWQKKHPKLEIPTYRPDEAIRRFHLQMIQKGMEAALSDKQEDFEARDITGTIMPLNPARLAEAKARIRRFRRSLLNYVTQGKCTELYQLNVQYFPLTRPSRTGAKREAP